MGSGLWIIGFEIFPTHGWDTEETVGWLKFESNGAAIFFSECSVEGSIWCECINGDAAYYFQNCAIADTCVGSGPGFVYVDGGMCHIGYYSVNRCWIVADAGVFGLTGGFLPTRRRSDAQLRTPHHQPVRLAL